MSLFGAMTTAISGLNAQSRALGQVSNNLANSQTVGYKRVDTSFIEMVTQSSRSANATGSVLARPDYTNSVQGTVEQSDNSSALAISGQGFFSVAAALGTNAGAPTFDERQFVTRAGDFQLNKTGYMVNSAGYYLQGWPVDSAGEPNRTALAPMQVSQQLFNPVATTQIELAANLPADGVTRVNTQVPLYDALGSSHVANLTFTPVTTPGPPPAGTSQWDLEIALPDEAVPTTRRVRLQFGGAAVPAVDPGTLGGLSAATNLTPGTTALGDAATQFSAGEFSVRNLTQNGVPPGSYSGLQIGDNGDVTVNYDNGQARVVGRIPLVTFSDPDALQRLDGQAFMRTVESGEARVTDVATDGAGQLVAGAVERSNVDIATEFTKLIVAQRA